MGMIVKEIRAGEGRRAKETIDYIRDVDHAADTGTRMGEKVHSHGCGNSIAEDFDGAGAEIIALEHCHTTGKGEATAHCIVSLRPEDGIPTPEQEDDIARQIVNDLGYSGPYVRCSHINDGWHMHLCVSRVLSEPDSKGQYRLENDSGKFRWTESGQTNRYDCLHYSAAILCARHGWTPEAGALFTPDGRKKERPVDPDRSRLGQGIEAWETHHGGAAHPKRIMADTARDTIRKSDSLQAIQNGLAADGLRLEILKKGARIVGPNDEKIKLSALPSDCSQKVKDLRHNGSEDRTSVKASNGYELYAGKLTVNQAKYRAREAFNGSESFEEAQTKLSAHNMRIERYGKSGAYLIYGEGEEERRMKLSDLGGKYSISSLSKKYKDEITPNARNVAKTQSTVNAETSQTRANARVSELSDRATTAAARATQAAAELSQAKSMSEALDDAMAAINAQARAQKITGLANKAENAAREAAAVVADLKAQTRKGGNMDQAHRPVPRAENDQRINDQYIAALADPQKPDPTKNPDPGQKAQTQKPTPDPEREREKERHRMEQQAAANKERERQHRAAQAARDRQRQQQRRGPRM